MNITFLLKKGVKRKKKPIYVVIHQEGRKYRFNTGIDIDPKDWRKNGGYPVANGRTAQLRHYLDRIRDDLERWYQQVYFEEKKKHLTRDEVKDKVEEITIGSHSDGSESKKLVDHFEDFIEEARNDGKAHGTIKKYKVTLTHLKEFAGSTHLEQVDQSFGKEFARYLSKEKCHENKTVNKSLKVFKTMLNRAEEKGKIEKGTGYSIQTLKEEEQEIIALEPHEIKTLEEAELNSKRLDRVRDLFLFTCYTSLRFGDLYSLKPTNFMENDEIHFISNKDSRNQEIPLCREAKEIAEKYDFQLPTISDTNYNLYLKELFQYLGLDRIVRFVKYYGDKPIEIEKHLYEVISSHVGRKTFVTDALRRGVSPELVREISGHSSLEAFKRYIKFSKEDKKGAVKRT